MIDAATFANSYNAFWHAYTPTCEHFVRRLNLSGLTRFAPPMINSGTSKRRALIAEYAFSIFVEQATRASGKEKLEVGESVEDAAWRAAEVRLRPYAYEGLELNREFDEEENREIVEISTRLYRCFSDPDRLAVFRPIFSGCGFVDASEGDVIFDRTIYEIKTVDRPFRSADVRQALTYSALNFSSEQFTIENVGLFNPRRGQFCKMELTDVCSEISGRPAQELLAIIIQTISSAGISR